MKTNYCYKTKNRKIFSKRLLAFIELLYIICTGHLMLLDKLSVRCQRTVRSHGIRLMTLAIYQQTQMVFLLLQSLYALLPNIKSTHCLESFSEVKNLDYFQAISIPWLAKYWLHTLHTQLHSPVKHRIEE